MGNLVKILTGILGILAIIVCLTTIGVIGYTLSGAGGRNANDQSVTNDEIRAEETQLADVPVPTSIPVNTDGVGENQPVSLNGHTHDYKESVEKKATCYQAGRLKYTCEECGDVYYVDVLSTGHVSDDEWEIVREATADRDGLRVKRCIYCDEIVVQETIPYASGSDTKDQSHTHEYLASTEREPTCILAGLRKYTCSCGSFYTEQIPAPGHIATDWEVAEEATTTKYGREQRTCVECGVVLDSRPVPVKEASPSPSASAASSSASPRATTSASPRATVSAAPGSTASSQPSASAQPTATPHVHQYVSYVIKEANCTEKGIRSFVCSCGSSRAEAIDLDLNRHDYVATVIPATSLSPGYTLYRCRRCNNTYMDNYTQMLK